MTCSRFTVTGRVQGVGFRAWTRRTALALGLRGWVRNRPDGSVELLALGPDESVASLREALWRGPLFSRVASVDEQQCPQAPSACPPDATDAQDGQRAETPHDFTIRH